MRAEHLVYLACPACRGALRVARIDREHEERIEEGELACTGCATAYPVLRHVPRFVPADNYARSFGFQWQRYAATQLDEHTGTDASARRFFEETRWPRRMDGELMLEAGCGAGRFTGIAADTGAMVVSFDYSEAVDANYANHGHRENVLIVQGDIFAPPVPAASFDRVFCLGVLQHTPDPERAWRSLLTLPRPGGLIAVDVYARRWYSRIVHTKYWVRPLTRRVQPERLHRWIDGYVRTMWPLVRVLGRTRAGARVSSVLLIQDNGRTYPLTDERRREWAVLDTFDNLAPAMEHPQTLEAVQRWIAESGLEEGTAHFGWNGIEARGRVPLTPRPQGAARPAAAARG